MPPHGCTVTQPAIRVKECFDSRVDGWIRLPVFLFILFWVSMLSMQVNVGKGGHWLFPYLLEKYHLSPVEACIIGDRLDTDIAMGKEGDLVTILPLTGKRCTRQGMYCFDFDLHGFAWDVL